MAVGVAIGQMAPALREERMPGQEDGSRAGTCTEHTGQASLASCSKGAGHGGKDLSGVIACHQVTTGPEVRLAPGKAGRHLAGDGDGNLRVLPAVPQVDRGGHLLQAEASRTAVPEQIGGHDRGPCR